MKTVKSIVAKLKSAPLYLVMTSISSTGINLRIFSLKAANKTRDGLNWSYPSTGANKKVPVDSIGNIDTSDINSYKAYIPVKSGVEALAQAVLSKHERDIQKEKTVARVETAPVKVPAVAKEEVQAKVQAPVAKEEVRVIKSVTGKEFTGKDLEDVKSVESMLAGNKNAFTGIYKRYYSVIRQKYMTSLKYNQDVVDDLTQDLFIKVSENIHKYSKDYTFNSWITRVAKNHMLDYIRKSKLETLSYDNEISGEHGETISFQPADKSALSGEEEMIEAERKSAVSYMLSTLGEKTASIVKKRYFDGLSYDEIAKEEGMVLSEIKIALFRAKAKLHKLAINNPVLMNACID